MRGSSLPRLGKRSRQPLFQLNGRCPKGHTMAEHLNIVTVLEKAISPAERLGMVFDLAKSYAPFFDNLHEICRNNYKTDVAQCEPWPEGESLLAAGAGNDELLFIYGDQSIGAGGARSSIGIEENGVRAQFVVSLPLPRNFDLDELRQFLMETANVTRRISNTFVVAAGRELESDIDRKVDDGLPKVLAEDWTCERIVVPRHLISVPLRCFATLVESDQAILLKRTSMP